MANTPKTIVDVVGAVKDYTAENYASMQLLRNAEVVDGKNFLPISPNSTLYGYETASKTIAFYVDSDGYIYQSDTSVNDGRIFTDFTCCQVSFMLAAGTYRLYQAPKASGTGWISTWLIDTAGNKIAGADSSPTNNDSVYQEFTLSADKLVGIIAKVSDRSARLWIYNASEADNTYTPYYAPLKNAMFRRSEQQVLGAKNLLQFPYAHTTKTQNGITWTVNDDESITINGTATAITTFRLVYGTGAQLQWLAGKIISIGIKGSLGSVYCDVALEQSPWTRIARIADNKTEVLIPSIPSDNLPYTIKLCVLEGVAVNSITVKPMLRLASDPDDTYAPYAMTNLELTDAVKNISTIDTALSATSTNPVQNKAIGGNLIDNGKTFKFGYRTSDSKYGYYDSGSTFHPFREPTGDAAVGNVLSGKTFSNASGDGLTGTMTNRGAVSQTLNPGGSYTIPEGYHNGNGIISASSGLAAKTLKEGTFTIQSYSDYTLNLNVSDTTIIPLWTGSGSILVIKFYILFIDPNVKDSNNVKHPSYKFLMNLEDQYIIGSNNYVLESENGMCISNSLFYDCCRFIPTDMTVYSPWRVYERNNVYTNPFQWVYCDSEAYQVVDTTSVFNTSQNKIEFAKIVIKAQYLNYIKAAFPVVGNTLSYKLMAYIIK